MGPEIGNLEVELSKYTGAKHCISCSSGTDALLLAMMAINIKPGDEVITTPFTFISTAETISLLGAKPVFVDIDKETFNINFNLIEAKITTQNKSNYSSFFVRQVANIDEINTLAKKYNLSVIEDAALKLRGLVIKGRKSCNL